MSWYYAVAFCRWLSKRLGYEVRLPTEWEWQQGASGGDPANVYPWGKDWDSDRVNTKESGLKRTTAVGMYPHGASPIGAFDMSGNVWEWCLNKYNNPKQCELTGTEWRVIRGNDWGGYWPSAEPRVAARAAFRSGYYPSNGLSSFGVRLCGGGPTNS